MFNQNKVLNNLFIQIVIMDHSPLFIIENSAD